MKSYSCSPAKVNEDNLILLIKDTKSNAEDIPFWDLTQFSVETDFQFFEFEGPDFPVSGFYSFYKNSF